MWNTNINKLSYVKKYIIKISIWIKISNLIKYLYNIYIKINFCFNLKRDEIVLCLQK